MKNRTARRSRRRSQTRKTSHSQAIFREARKLIPGGVDSPVRSFAAVGGEPFFVRGGRGSRLRDADGNFYLDYVMSYGPLLFGHAPGRIVQAVRSAARLGTSFGAPTELEVMLARRVCRAMPSIERVRFVSSGTEAAMSAVRVARGFTKRDMIVKTDGGYHGHADSFLVAAGSGAATLGIAGSPGVPQALAEKTLVVPYNDPEALEAAFQAHPGRIAAFIVEPIAANMGVVLPKPGYLTAAREVTRKHEALLIFDEVITGFRVALGGAQELLGVVPDLTCLGKIIGGGLPVGAYGGRADVMAMVAPDGPVYQAGTLSGNPLAMSAGIAMLDAILREKPHADLERKAVEFERLMAGEIESAGASKKVCWNRVGSMGTLFFTPGPVTSYTDAKKSDTAAYARYFHAALDRGVFLAPAQFEAMFFSTAHSDADIRKTARVLGESLRVALGS
ncbi:MAG: glutamate-1-semialdehyde 2,1-aminomutase [Thermoanaerobaculia bacterium]